MYLHGPWNFNNKWSLFGAALSFSGFLLFAGGLILWFLTDFPATWGWWL